MYARSGVLPSQLYQGKVTEELHLARQKWGRLCGNSRYNCCFVCVDASLPVLDQFVDKRVDRMIEAGLLDEVYNIYNLNADYTRGLRQAIGVREFEDFLSAQMDYFQESASPKNADISLRQS
ncbi:tRNA dimethylallyltransferase 2 [Bienertia sinuspersici]